MAGETIIQGDTLILSVWDGALAYRPVACLTSNSFSAAVEVLETKTKCDPGNTVKTYGSASYTLSLEGQYIDTTSAGGETTKASHDYLLGLLDAKTERTFSLATGLADTPTYYMQGIITDLELAGDAGENATFSATVEVTGGYTTTNPN